MPSLSESLSSRSNGCTKRLSCFCKHWISSFYSARTQVWVVAEGASYLLGCGFSSNNMSLPLEKCTVTPLSARTQVWVVAQDASYLLGSGFASNNMSVPLDVSSVSHNQSSAAGGLPVTILGHGFSTVPHDVSVTFANSNMAYEGTVISSTNDTLVVRTPRVPEALNADITLDIIITPTRGAPATTTTFSMTFKTGLAPSVMGISPSRGSTAGGTTITVGGEQVCPPSISRLQQPCRVFRSLALCVPEDMLPQTHVSGASHHLAACVRSANFACPCSIQSLRSIFACAIQGRMLDSIFEQRVQGWMPWIQLLHRRYTGKKSKQVRATTLQCGASIAPIHSMLPLVLHEHTNAGDCKQHVRRLCFRVPCDHWQP